MEGDRSIWESGETATGNHFLKFSITGDMESVRARLISAAGQLGYDVLNEEPLFLRRAKDKPLVARSLQYITSLTIRLKSGPSNLTQVTFDYAYYNVYGEAYKSVLAREAEAIMAFASNRNTGVTCQSCGSKA